MIAGLALLLSPALLRGGTVTFENFPSQSSLYRDVAHYTPVYTEGGFTFTARVADSRLGSFEPPTNPPDPNFSRSMFSLFSDYFTVTSTSGSPFTFTAADFANLGSGTNAFGGTITGTKPVGSPVVRTFSVPQNTVGFYHVEFAGFVNVTSLQFEIGSSRIDNVALSAAPVPSATYGGLVLLGGVAGYRLRIRRRTATAG